MVIAKLESVLRATTGVPADWEVAEGWARYTTPGAVTHYRNGVVTSVLDERDVDTRIAETIKHFKNVGHPFRWLVTPTTRPEGFGDQLLAHGFSYFETLEGLIARPENFDGPFPDVRESGPDDADDYLGAGECAWGYLPAALPRFRKAFDEGQRLDPRRTFYFTAYADGEPAGNCSLTLNDGFAHFDGAATVKEHRRRGLYQQMLFARMAFVRERGVPLVTSHCVSTTSAPICKKLGFEKACEFLVYVYPPPKSDASCTNQS